MSEPFALGSTPLPALELLDILEKGGSALDAYLAEEIYVNHDPGYLAGQKQRYVSTLRLHIEKVGNQPTFLLRAPGRLNAFLEYLDMCDGDHMSTTIDGDIPVAVTPRDDDMVACFNGHPLFPPGEFSISRELALFRGASWTSDIVGNMADTWDNRTRVYPYHGQTQGAWLNYVRASFLRVAWELPEADLRGAYMTVGPSTGPFRAGTSSSSAIVVLSFLALFLANRDRLPAWDVREICRLLGEAEWYVGTHGGANDQTTILRSLPNGVLYNRHSRKPLDSTPLPCLSGVRVVIANSLWEANKTLGANHVFNLRKGWMDLGDDLTTMILTAAKEQIASGGATGSGWLGDLVSARFGFPPDPAPVLLASDPSLWDAVFANYHKLGSLVEDLLHVPNAAIEELIGLLPAEISPESAAALLGKDMTAMQHDYTLPYESEGGYRVRAAATFFYKENRIGRSLERIFREADSRLKSGQIAESSDEYEEYRLEVGKLLDDLQDTIRDDFQVSNEQLDLLLDIAREGPGYLGGKLTGAGSGGCVSILVREGSEDDLCDYLDREYYGKPELFSDYRSTLDALESGSPEGSIEHKAASEMRSNLDHALSHPSDQRRAVTFSRGACIVDLPRFA